MIKKFLNKFIKKSEKLIPEKPEKKERPRQFSTDWYGMEGLSEKIENSWNKTFKNSITPGLKITLDNAFNKSDKLGFAMDNMINVKAPFYGNDILPPGQLSWYSNQTFLGYQICSMLSQQWLISKCCLMPAEDATRNGYEITVNNGQEVDVKILDEMRKFDVEYNINKNLVQFVQMGRIFGIRIAMFKVESDDPEYYYKPFNADGVQAGSYKGISQIDPYWISPQLDAESAGDPSSINFYEPTWWNIAGKLIHRTHLIIYRTEEVPDILKPTYVYGGIPIPQKIVERVYAAERTANEAPMLALTKRTDVLTTDTDQAVANEINFIQRIQRWVFNRDNYGIKVVGEHEKMEQFDTSLADLDAVIMTQYQLVAAAANVPAVKLLGTSPKGFNATGEFEEANYHEMLESIQTHALTPLLDRHHLLLIRSEIIPKFNIDLFNTCISWKSIDAMTAEELALLNKMKAETGSILMNIGAIDGNDERQRIINDPESGYIGLTQENEENNSEEILVEPTDE